MMSLDEKRAAKLDRFLGQLTEEAEFFGLTGVGYPDSLYRVYVRSRAASQSWWRLELSARPAGTKPIRYYAGLPTMPPGLTVIAPIADLLKYQYDPRSAAVAKLFARVAQIYGREVPVLRAQAAELQPA